MMVMSPLHSDVPIPLPCSLALPFTVPQMPSPMMGDNLLSESMMASSTPSSAIKHKARPKSSSVNAAAWRAYGSPSARGMPRKSPSPDNTHPNPKSSIIDTMPG